MAASVADHDYLPALTLVTAPKTVDRFSWERSLRRLKVGKATKAVALMLATYADRNGTNAHPGVLRLAADLESDERTVRRHLTRLMGLGLIDRTFEGSKAGRHKLSDCYSLTLPANPAAIGLTDCPSLGSPGTGVR